MSNKDLQEQRIKRYFIDSAKEILKGEGLSSLNVRNIAERAGYSYATLYNYFKNINDLYFICIEEFHNECLEIINQETIKVKVGFPKIKAISKSYIKYFIQYPGIFELFYIERNSTFGSQEKTNELITYFYDSIIQEEIKTLIESKTISKEDGRVLTSLLKNSITGLLLFYINRNNPKTYSQFDKDTDQTLDQILKIIK